MFAPYTMFSNFPRGGIGRVVIPKESIEGSMPAELCGTWIRNGPGLNEVFGTKLRHPIDGDGFVSTITFEEGTVTFQGRFVQTLTHAAESKEQKMLFAGQMGSTASTVDRKKGWRDMAHTNAFYWGGKILACHEYTFPHALDPVSLRTLGKDTMGGHFDQTRAVCAHFRLDQNLNRICVIGFKPGLKANPILTIVEFDSQWNAAAKQIVRVPKLDYVHDLLVTPSWYIVQMSPFVEISAENTKKILRGEEFPGDQFRYNPKHPSCIVLIERHAKGEPKVKLFDDPIHGE
eukprot:GEMP01032213.1.p1 GENE.GEMP01032213.1~~GEMP01032213.1.p1  ORF type:complete len:318 (+),score=44.93 GEMP01032213.1:90-956(+)